MTEPDRASNYRTALRVAQRALCELRDEPDLARFLDHGLTATQVSELHLPCKRIDAMLALDLDMDPAQPSARKARSTRTTSGIAERP